MPEKKLKYLLLFSQESKVVITKFTVCVFFLGGEADGKVHRHIQTEKCFKKKSQFPINVL